MGGTGKTPVVAAIAEWLIGRRPSSVDSDARLRPRGCRRRRRRDHHDARSSDQPPSLAQTGDEPLMLARQVPGATVCVSPDRYLGGVLAEKLGCTVHVLDDGFQHIELARDLDILVTTVGEIPNGRVIPLGAVAGAEGCGGARAFPGGDGCHGGRGERGSAGTLGISQIVRLARNAGRDRSGSGIRDRGTGSGEFLRLLASPIPNDSFNRSVTAGGMSSTR